MMFKILLHSACFVTSVNGDEVPAADSCKSKSNKWPDSTDTKVPTWKDSKSSRYLPQVKKKNIPGVLKIFMKEMGLKDHAAAADQLSSNLQSMCNGANSSGATQRFTGDLDDDRMIFAIFHCKEVADDLFSINFVVHTLTINLSRKDTKTNIASVSDISSPLLSEKMICDITQGLEADLQQIMRSSDEAGADGSTATDLGNGAEPTSAAIAYGFTALVLLLINA